MSPEAHRHDKSMAAMIRLNILNRRAKGKSFRQGGREHSVCHALSRFGGMGAAAQVGRPPCRMVHGRGGFCYGRMLEFITSPKALLLPFYLRAHLLDALFRFLREATHSSSSADFCFHRREGGGLSVWSKGWTSRPWRTSQSWRRTEGRTWLVPQALPFVHFQVRDGGDKDRRREHPRPRRAPAEEER